MAAMVMAEAERLRASEDPGRRDVAAYEWPAGSSRGFASGFCVHTVLAVTRFLPSAFDR